MTIALIQTVFQSNTGASEDRFVTTTHWESAEPLVTFPQLCDDAFTLLQAFWETAGPGGFGTIGIHIPTFVNRAYTMRGYDQSLPPFERAPYIGASTLPNAVIGTGAYPSEVAICLSYVGGSSPYTPGDRGRMYIGPLTLDAGESYATGGAPNRPTSTFRAMLADSANQMRNSETPNNAVWSTRSTVLNKVERGSPLYQPVNGGWVDNAFDTQRRRGERQSGRTYFGTLPDG